MLQVEQHVAKRLGRPPLPEIDVGDNFSNYSVMDGPASIVSYPPRAIPLSTRLVVLLGGPLAILGWVFGGIGMVFAILFVRQADFSSSIHFRGPLETAPGIITASEETRSSEGGGQHRKGTPIFEHHYQFTFGGAEYTGMAYCTGGGLRDNQPVMVEFPAGKPTVSRIQGMRRAMFGPGVAFVLIFPVIGFVFVGIGLWTGRKNVSLLINGELAQARNTGKEATNTRVSNRTVYKVWFEFTDRNGAMQKVSTRTSKPEMLEGSAFEPLFYDVANPTRCTLLHAIPGKVALDERGQIQGSSFGRVLGAVWGPPLVAVVTVVCLYFSR